MQWIFFFLEKRKKKKKFSFLLFSRSMLAKVCASLPPSASSFVSLPLQWGVAPAHPPLWQSWHWKATNSNHQPCQWHHKLKNIWRHQICTVETEKMPLLDKWLSKIRSSRARGELKSSSVVARFSLRQTWINIVSLELQLDPKSQMTIGVLWSNGLPLGVHPQSPLLKLMILSPIPFLILHCPNQLG